MGTARYQIKSRVKLKLRGLRVVRVWWFQLIGPNGEPQGTSEEYVSRSSAAQGIEDFRRNAATTVVVWDQQTLDDD